MRTPNNSTEPHMWPININLQILLDSLFTSILVPSCALAFWQSAAAALSRVRSAAAGSRGAERSSAGRLLFHWPGDQASTTRISMSSSWASAACRHHEDEAAADATTTCRPAHLRCTSSLSTNHSLFVDQSLCRRKNWSWGSYTICWCRPCMLARCRGILVVPARHPGRKRTLEESSINSHVIYRPCRGINISCLYHHVVDPLYDWWAPRRFLVSLCNLVLC
jgi:hypothetical protein